MKYYKGYKYLLAEDEHTKISVYPDKNIVTPYIKLDMRGNLIIKKGYAWDGCSGPTKDTKTNMTPGFVHDALYQLMRMDLLSQKWRMDVDMNFKQMCLDRGMWEFRAWYYYKGVREFGLSSASAENRKEILEAP